MFRNLSLATAFSVAFAAPVLAADTNIKVDPGTGPTSTMTDRVPHMKSDASGFNADGSSSANLLPVAKAMNDAVPSMRPGDALSGQLDTKSSAATLTPGTGLSLTMQEGESWIKKPVYSNDGKKKSGPSHPSSATLITRLSECTPTSADTSALVAVAST